MPNKSQPNLQNSVIWLDRRTGLHTHPSVTLTSFHSSHSHANSTVTAVAATHAHAPLTSPSVACGYSGASSHTHAVTFTAGGSHNHTNVVLSFGDSNLGDPNWWAHTHAITLVSMDNGGGAHNDHSFPASTNNNSVCIKCIGTPHTHTVNGSSVANGGAVHTHTVTGKITGNATTPPGTAESHVHAFSTQVDVGDSHNHVYTWGADPIVANVCGKGSNHDHTEGVGSNVTHPHTIAGDTGDGGEGSTQYVPNKMHIYTTQRNHVAD